VLVVFVVVLVVLEVFQRVEMGLPVLLGVGVVVFVEIAQVLMETRAFETLELGLLLEGV
jgi:glycopeptide antibiotics resistance protein